MRLDDEMALDEGREGLSYGSIPEEKAVRHTDLLGEIDMERLRDHGTEKFDEWLRICWGRQECGSCLDRRKGDGDVVCSWCPASGTCIPNPSSIQLLAPITNPDICPLWSERWELRTSTLGCHVSTITFLTCIVSVLSTFAVAGLVVGAVFFGRWARRAWLGRGERWWCFWGGWRLRLVNVVKRRERDEVYEEQRPLLDAE